MSYTIMVSLHVIIAVVGVGLAGAIPLAAAFARSGEPATRLLEALFRFTRGGLAAVVATGALTEWAAHGAFHGSGWFRLSFALLVFAGFSQSRARAAFSQSRLPGADGRAALGRVVRWGWTVCVTVAVVAFLMEAKPF